MDLIEDQRWRQNFNALFAEQIIEEITTGVGECLYFDTHKDEASLRIFTTIDGRHLMGSTNIEPAEGGVESTLVIHSLESFAPRIHLMTQKLPRLDFLTAKPESLKMWKTGSHSMRITKWGVISMLLSKMPNFFGAHKTSAWMRLIAHRDYFGSDWKTISEQFVHGHILNLPLKFEIFGDDLYQLLAVEEKMDIDDPLKSNLLNEIATAMLPLQALD